MNGPVLRDIHLPPAGWWPPAPGWWLLAGIAVLIAALVLAGLYWRKRRGPLRAALCEIETLAAVHARDGDAQRVVDGVSRLMRRVARRVEPGVAACSGEAWIAFVHRHARDDETRDVLDHLARVRFSAQSVVDVVALIAALRAWCRSALRTRASTPFGTKGVDTASLGMREGPAP
ncbi:MAG TPA: DUF4381 domain-containing protein [Rhodanobacteraceae bacterium]|nr:DUF4381 domain-containing protein [Rhodanobacteraceae bacterium]